MPHYEAIGYQSSFRKAVPVRGEGCIRVTHPSAARQQALLLLLPPDLHVLGLPLAFILSQDQTLRCINSLLYQGCLCCRNCVLPVHVLVLPAIKAGQTPCASCSILSMFVCVVSSLRRFSMSAVLFFCAAKLGRFLFSSKLFMFSFC